MHNGKQVTKRPHKKVGGHEKGRKEEGKGGEPAVAFRKRLRQAPTPPDQPKVGIVRLNRDGP